MPTDWSRWTDPASFQPSWENRAKAAGSLIRPNSVVLDLGCGAMALRGFLPGGCRYIGCDLVARDAETIVCDFNAGDFPIKRAGEADIITMLGLLEYIADLQSFASTICEASRGEAIFSYHPIDAENRRHDERWLNGVIEEELLSLFPSLVLLRRILLPRGEALFHMGHGAPCMRSQNCGARPPSTPAPQKPSIC